MNIEQLNIDLKILTVWLKANKLSLNSRKTEILIFKNPNKPLTYDQSFKPHMIGVTKNWLSIHTGNLHGEKNAHRLMYEDQFIRRFLQGTFYRIIAGEVVIKRIYNSVEIIMFLKHPQQRGGQMHFLKGYSEKLLSAFLKCNVRLTMHKVLEEDMQYKFI